jgi:2,4-dienoyl-CoA reductase-like NADH-dependent reductase (Old Yellow Enzyme family)
MRGQIPSRDEPTVGAGFDGTMVRGSNGNLTERFLQDVWNKRTGEYGGSEQGSARFPEVFEVITESIGGYRAVIRVG